MNLFLVARSGTPRMLRFAHETYRANTEQLAALSAMFRRDGAGRFANTAFSSFELVVDPTNRKISIDSVLGGERKISSFKVNQPAAGEPWAIEGKSDFYGFALRGVSAQRPKQALGSFSYSVPGDWLSAGVPREVYLTAG